MEREKEDYITKGMTPEEIEKAGKDIYSTNDRLAKIIKNDDARHTELLKYFHNKKGIADLEEKYGYKMDYDPYVKWNTDPELRSLGGAEAAAKYHEQSKELGYNSVKDYLKAERDYEGGAVQKAKDKAKAKELGIQIDDYAKYQEKYPGGAEAKVSDTQMLKDLGIVDKDGNAKTSHFNKVMEKAGDNADRIRQDFPKLRQLGLPDKADYNYVKALNELPRVTPAEFARIYNAIDYNKENGLTEKELLEYINNNFTGDQQAEATHYFNAYGNDWKNKDKVPKKIKYENGKYKSYY
jgi:hypothetical protein